jgi:hypothetical protein
MLCVWFFSIKRLPLGFCFTSGSGFAYNFEFAEIFEFKVDAAVSMTPLSQHFFFSNKSFFVFGPKGLRQYGSLRAVFDLYFL